MKIHFLYNIICMNLYFLVGQGLPAVHIASTLKILITPHSQGPSQGPFWGHYCVQQPQISLIAYSYHGCPILFLGVISRASTHIVLSKKHHSPYEYLRSRTNNSSHTPSQPIPLLPLIDNINGTGMRLAELANLSGGLNAHVGNAK